MPSEGRNVIPSHYDVVLEPDLDNGSFQGTVKILIEVLEETSSISLNVCGLHILNTEVRLLPSFSAMDVNPTVSYNEEEQTACITLASPLEKTKLVQLTQTFKGTLNDQMAGLYLSRYTDGDGHPMVLMTSHMEPNEARCVFPCFDDPALKATFLVSLIAPRNFTCLSNMDVAEERLVAMAADKTVAENPRLKKVVRFNQSPKMSTYLLAFVVAELEYVESDMFHVPVRAFIPRRKGANLEHCRYSLDLAVKTLQFYEEIFGVEYPLPKLDLFAVPDFPAGAMENWGLITFREADLLFEEGNGSRSTKLRTTLTVQHEIAHQWFGNLVTMKTWDCLWLKEGFATWMSWYVCDKFFPDWKVWDTFAAGNLQSALHLDSLSSSHPLELSAQANKSKGFAFDAISYLKGCSLVRMIFSFLGEHAFMAGIRRYLNTHAYGNASVDDLWAALGTSAETDFVDMMSRWTTQVGYPVVTVTASTGAIFLQQTRHMLCRDSSSQIESDMYPIPLSIRTQQALQEVVFAKASMQIETDGFVKINVGQTGIYRTRYDPVHLEKLAAIWTESDKLSISDRIGIVADTGALAASGRVRTSDFLKLLRGIAREPEPVVWETMLNHLRIVRSAWLFECAELLEKFDVFVQNLLGKQLSGQALQWGNANEAGKQLQALLIDAAGQAGEANVITVAMKMFSDWAQSGTRIDANLRPSIFRVALQHDGQDKYSKVLDEYMNAKTSADRNIALQCLGYAEALPLIEQTLELASSEHVRNQDLQFAFVSLQTHKLGAELAWLWLQQNWSALSQRLSPFALGKLLTASTEGLATEEQRKSVEAFFGTQDVQGIETPLAQVLESIEIKRLWVARDRHDVAAFLAQQ